MDKKITYDKKMVYIMIFTFIVIIMFIIGYSCNHYEKKQNQKKCDQRFTQLLQFARQEFNTDYSKVDNRDIIPYYIDGASNLYSAVQLLDLTSYDEKNHNNLFTAIYELYLCVKNNNSRQIILSNDNQQMVYNYLGKIIRNPLDRSATKKLGDFAEEVFTKYN